MKNGPIYERIDRELNQRKSGQLFRSVPRPRLSGEEIDFSTNSYLSLHTNEQVALAARKLCDENLSGNCASRLVAQNSMLYNELESEIASLEKSETALVFNSGYAANLGILQSICTKDTEVFCDRLNHASIYDGIILSRCKLSRYRHNDMADLRQRLVASKAKEKLIVTDSVFSMDGDRAPLEDISELASTYDCLIMVDEAHATGIFGATGAGLAEETGTADRIDIRMGTLSKSVAGLGGYFAGSAMLRDYFVNNARSFIYSTGLPHSILAQNIAGIRFIRANPESGKLLLERAADFRSSLKAEGFDTMDSSTQIIPCKMRSAAEALSLSAYLRDFRIIAPAIRPPTVPEGTARLRFSIFLDLDDKRREFTLSKLAQWKKSHV